MRLDWLLGGWWLWRRVRGGRWEHVAATCACPVDTWERVPLFRPRHHPKVLNREDYR